MGHKQSPSASSLVRHFFISVVKETYISHSLDSLMRAFLNSRTGVQKSDNVVYYLIPRVVQMGLFATIWAISGLVAFIFTPMVGSLFDLTAGAIYTHVSDSALREPFFLKGATCR